MAFLACRRRTRLHSRKDRLAPQESARREQLGREDDQQKRDLLRKAWRRFTLKRSARVETRKKPRRPIVFAHDDLAVN